MLNEIFIGSYVSNSLYGICTVQGIIQETNQLILKSSSQEDFKIFPTENWEGVKITEELLEKLGFIYNDGFMDCYSLTKDLTLTLYLPPCEDETLNGVKGGWVFEINNVQAGVKYLHQIQALYKLLLNKELKLK